MAEQTDDQARDELGDALEGAVTSEPTPWGTGLTFAGLAAAVTAAAIAVLSVGVNRVHPLLTIGLNLVAVGGLAPTLWGWRRVPVRRWFVLGVAVGVAVGWVIVLVTMVR